MKATLINRRNLLKSGASAAIVAASLQQASCNPADANQWIQIAIADLPTLLQIITAVISMAKQGNIPPETVTEINNIAQEVQNDLQTAQQLIAAYESKKTPDTLAKIDAALSAAQAGLNNILQGLHIQNPTLQATIAAALGSALTVVTAIISLVPPAPAAGEKRMTLAKSSKKDGNEAIKQSFNLIVGKHYPQAAM